MKKKACYILIHLVMLFIIKGANANYYKNNCAAENLGWNFYCDPDVENHSKTETKPQTKQENKKLDIGEYATQEVEQMREKLKELLNIATVFPTEENIKNYIKYSQYIMDKSSYVAEVAQRAIWQNPEIDYSLKRPVNSIGKRSWIDQRNNEIDTTMQNLNERYGLFFVYRSTCPYCHAYSPIIKQFSEEFNIKVIAISQDGPKLKEWPNSKLDNGQSINLKIDTVPATILFDKETSEIIPVGFGALSMQELKQRIFNLTEIELGQDL